MPPWLDVLLGGVGASVMSAAIAEVRDRRRARRAETERVAAETAATTERQEAEIGELRRAVARLEGRLDERGKAS